MGLGHLAERLPPQLSGGQQQRVAIARALVYEPPVILLDEPLSNLDAKLREEARAFLRTLITTLGLSAIHVTHDQLEAMALADRIVLLQGGRIAQDGPPTALYNEPASLFAAEFMGSNNRLEGKLVERANGRATLEVFGERLTGVARTKAAPGDKAVGIIRLERMRCAREPGPEPAGDAARSADVSGRALGTAVRARRGHGARLCARAAAGGRALCRVSGGRAVGVLTLHPSSASREARDPVNASLDVMRMNCYASEYWMPRLRGT